MLTRYMISLLPYFTWLMIVVTIVALCGQISEIYIGSANVMEAVPIYLWWLDLLFVLFTLSELILKVSPPYTSQPPCRSSVSYGSCQQLACCAILE